MKKNIAAFSLNEISLLDDYYLGVSQKMVDFLNTFNPDKLLFNFRATAGIPNKKANISYGGWENTRVGGHTMGHYMTAAAQAIARGYGNCKGPDGLSLHERLEYIISSLQECQNVLGTGFIFGATMADPQKPELQFDKLERGDYSDTWVPWYTAHKILSGLVDVFSFTGNKTALAVAENFGEWVYGRTCRWTAEEREAVLRVEFGGMNDCLYALYRVSLAQNYGKNDHTRSPEHFLQAAHAFDEEWLYQHTEAIVNRHANTTIPKFVGAATRCMILREQKKDAEADEYLAYCENFWQEVVNHHTYITGGNSECEHFGLPDILDAERSNTNCETCNTYNMLKLSRLLFMMTGKRKYADYYENTFLNAIMASVNEKDATTTYFQPMATGCFKTYCNADVDKNFFWCCTGTGLENFTKLGDSFYFYDDETLFVNMYVSSCVNWEEKGVHLTQKTEIPLTDYAEFEVDFADGRMQSDFTLAFRLPDWLSGKPSFKLNGSPMDAPDASSDVLGTSSDAPNAQDAPDSEGYFYISRRWSAGDRVTVVLPMGIAAYSLPDSPGKTFGFKYGPVVLAAELGADEKMIAGEVGANTAVCANKIVCGAEMSLNGNYGGTSNLNILETEIIQVNGGAGCADGADSVAEFMKNPSAHFVRLADSAAVSPRFRLNDTDFPGDFIFSAYNRLSGQRYGIYWVFVSNDRQKALEKKSAYHEDEGEVFIEGVGVGYGAQTEGNAQVYPHLQEAQSVPDPHELTRYARAGGYFSYEFAVKPGKKNFLVCTFLKADDGKTLRITASEAEAPSTEGSAPTGTASTEGGTSTKAPSTPVLPIAELTLDSRGAGEKYTMRFAIPSELTASSETLECAEQKKTIRIRFSSASAEAPSARLCAPVKTVYTK